MTKFITHIAGIAFLLLFSCDAYANLIIDNAPVTIIRGTNSELDRPEGVTFSPSGEYVATANALINTITFYKRIGDHGAVYETTPTFSIKGAASQLDYPHDLAFSPDGLHLAVANRLGNSITIYKKNRVNNHFDNKPIAVIQGKSSHVLSPDAVRYSPIENVLAVANTSNNAITLYRYKGNVYEPIPYQIIQGTPDLLAIPDSVDFSSDGELLATTSHDTHSVLIYQKIPASRGMYTSKPVEVIQGPETNFQYPHSVSFHPTKQYLLVSCSQGEKNINLFQQTSDLFPRYSHKPILSLAITEMYDPSTIHLLKELHQEGGCKGVSFSPDGTAFATTQNLCADLLKLPYSIGVLLIYSVTMTE